MKLSPEMKEEFLKPWKALVRFTLFLLIFNVALFLLTLAVWTIGRYL